MDTEKRILVVEDDNEINWMINEALIKAGYNCVGAHTGTEALLRLQNEHYDMAILDLMLPGLDGKEVLTQARTFTDIPFLVLSARDELDTKVDLLTLGANDYMTKPFELDELLARVLVQLRISAANGSFHECVLSHQELKLDLDKKQFFVCGALVPLTAQEMKIMELFLKHPGKVFSKDEIYQYAWNDSYMGEDKTINVHISNIRQKIKKHTDRDYIETVWGLGFKL